MNQKTHVSTERPRRDYAFAQKVHEFRHSRSKANSSAKTEDLPTALAGITGREEEEKRKFLVGKKM